MSRSQFEDDIYDFDDFLESSKKSNRPSRTYTLDENGNIVRPRNRSRANEVKVKLPAVLAGQPRGPVRSGVDLSAMTNDRRLRVDPGSLNRPILERHHVNGPRQTKEMCPSTYYPCYNSPATEIEHTSAGQLNTRVATGTRASPSTTMYTPHTPVPPAHHAPAPPTVNKPDHDNQSYSKSRRRVNYRNQELVQDVSIHKPALPQMPKQSKPVSPVAEFIEDFDREVKEAIEMEKKFVALDEKMRKLKNECSDFSGNGNREVIKEDYVDDFLNELDDMLKTSPPVTTRTSQAASSGMDGSLSYTTHDSAVPRITREPMKQWNGQTAKRGVGFRSKLKKEEPKVRRVNDGVIPDRIRRQMEERVKGSAKF